jgi:hypothetical protein
VGLIGGFFDAIGGTAISAYDSNGNLLGSVANDQLGLEFLGLVTSDNSALISGLLFSLVGPEPAGFAVDDIRFGVGNQVINPVPLPAALPLMGSVFCAGGFLAAWRKRRSKKSSAALEAA